MHFLGLCTQSSFPTPEPSSPCIPGPPASPVQLCSVSDVGAHVLISSKAEAPQEVCTVNLPPPFLPHLAQASMSLLQP